MRLLSTPDLAFHWEAMVAHEKLHYGNDGYLEAKERVLEDWWKNKCHWWAAVMDPNSAKILSSGSVTLLSKETFRQIISQGDKGPKNFPSYYRQIEKDASALPLLYISSIIISNRLHAPYLFKSLSRDLKNAQLEWDTRFEEVVSIALNKKSKFLLERHGFWPTGKCRQAYEVYQTDLKKSPIVNALLG